MPKLPSRRSTRGYQRGPHLYRRALPGGGVGFYAYLPSRPGGVYRLAVTLALRVEGSTREALRELVRGWCRARGVRCRAWAKGLQGDPTRRYGRR